MPRMRHVLAVIAAAVLLAVPAMAATASTPHHPAPTLRFTGNTHLIRVTHPPFTARTHLPHVFRTSSRVRNSTLVVTRNWSGYAVQACGTCAERYVETQFTTPSVNCSDPSADGSLAALWDGLDGFTSGTVEQTGVDMYCNGTHAEYFAWYEMFPLAPVYVAVAGFGPGDAVDASAYWDAGAGMYDLTFDDITQGVGFVAVQPCPSGSVCKNSSAEVIAEAPFGGSSFFNLADYGAAFFQNSRVTFRNGSHFNLENDPLGGSYAIDMVNGADVLATAGTLSDGSSAGLPVSAFTDTWHNFS